MQAQKVVRSSHLARWMQPGGHFGTVESFFGFSPDGGT
jgi:hypothetical protein